MRYKVIHSFKDLEDNKCLYVAGEDQTYPREGYEPSAERIEALSTTNNKEGKVFIEALEDNQEDGQEFPQATSGGWYVLSNGEKVQGKDKAEKAEAALKSGE